MKRLRCYKSNSRVPSSIEEEEFLEIHMTEKLSLFLSNKYVHSFGNWEYLYSPWTSVLFHHKFNKLAWVTGFRVYFFLVLTFYSLLFQAFDILLTNYHIVYNLYIFQMSSVTLVTFYMIRIIKLLKIYSQNNHFV